MDNIPIPAYHRGCRRLKLMRDNKHPSFAAKSRGFTKLRKKVLSSKKTKKTKKKKKSKPTSKHRCCEISF